jgi:peroxiredoxin
MVYLLVPLILFGAFSVRLKARLLAGPETDSPIRTGQPAPDLVLRDLNGVEHDLAQVVEGNQLVLVNFWATWCGPCKIEMPQFQGFYDEYASRGLEILAVTQEDREVVDSFLQGKPYTFPILLDPEGTVTEAYGVSALPTTVLVSPTRAVTRIRQGLDPFLERRIRTMMGDAPEVPDPLSVLDSLMDTPVEAAPDTSETETPPDTTGSEGGQHG